ncbi:shikimate kinase [Thermosipho atlanticus]|uniref:Shikimate kinase n=1 Tax=Thermosipho atlanticus DSM 15807 TaxID=1123380 RepID=A0A1M5SZS9_9BACT|nr:shikimate kinase [Thermosipho atlanticus]SHH43982.1 shikimate kinase [Thermosipho atlanticus DSM 15807]
MSIYIVGLPGSGKSAVGKILKEDFGYDVVDLDDVLKVEYKKGFNKILLDNGFNTLRTLEGKILKRFKKYNDKFIVTLGVLANLELFNGKIVYIKIPKEKYIQRINKISKKVKRINEVYEEIHNTFSQKADLVISSENKTKFEISKIIDDFYRKNRNI